MERVALAVGCLSELALSSKQYFMGLAANKNIFLRFVCVWVDMLNPTIAEGGLLPVDEGAADSINE